MEDPATRAQRLDDDDRRFESFVTAHGERLRRALISSNGVDAGSDAYAEAIAWAWEHWERVQELTNPAGYLFRVGQSAAGRQRRGHRHVMLPVDLGSDEIGEIDVRLESALVALSARQRTVALLVHGYGYSYAEVAEVTRSSLASVRNDLHRAMKRLRRKLDAQ
jgi:RNA polymerase sigma factor (sigma-70 family)